MIDPRFVIKLNTKNGPKEFVLLAGLLDLGHNRGLHGIETQILSEFCDPKEQSWVVQATGTFCTEAGMACFSAVGDANPSNSQMRGAFLRHAETRAIARMLRFATNVAMASVDELGPDADESPARPLARHEGKADTYREERVARTTDSPGDAAASGHGAEPQFCAECGLEVPASVAAAARQRFGGVVLCVADGKGRMAGEKAAAEA